MIWLRLLVCGVGCVVLSTFIFGLLPSIRARKLNKRDIEAIKQNGIIHKTTTKGKNGIMRDGVLKGCIGLGAYSNQFRKSAFFLIGGYLKKESEQYNDNKKYDYSIHITGVTDEQIKSMKIRRYDNTLIVCGDFVFCENNRISVEEIAETKNGKRARALVSGIKSCCSAAGLEFILVISIVTSILLNALDLI